MRQAGRYLPEYRELRRQVPDFLDLCFTPELATQVTLQPIKRFDFDAAILFSDILVIPHALGQRVSFTKGDGPQLFPPIKSKNISVLSSTIDQKILAPIYKTIRHVRDALPSHKALIGFCGGPWTVATYMVAGHGTPDQMPARLFAYQDPGAFSTLIDILISGSIDYLTEQFHAGVDAVQVFDTWAGILPPQQFERWCIKPMQQIVAGVRRNIPDAKFIGFPRGAGTSLVRYVEQVPVDAVGLDWTVDLAFARDEIQSRRPVQGNLDPLILLAGGDTLDRAIDTIMETFAEGPFIFNLGHGVLPDTPIAHVERMVARVRSGR